MIASIAFLAAINAPAQTLTSARILSSTGPVEIQRRAQGQTALMKISYRVNDELLAGDVIKTLKGGRLVLGLTDGSQAIISELTTVEITDLSKSPRTIFNLLRGKTRIKIEKVGGRPNPYRVNTPTAVVAVRGTLFDVLVTSKETQVFVHEGEVAVS
ncbi:MAG TPA: FecR family protein, partial [Pyrinomonadaceae bacterium]|nr:FecR family protein [Pyrinomonadaceae bacterium]